MTDARDTDRGYHAAKLTNWALLDPQKLHDEHAEWRESILAARSPAPAMSRADLWTATMRIHRRLIERGIITPTEVN